MFTLFRNSLLMLPILFLSITLQADERPNILVILCDDLGYGDLECYGHPTIKTPNLNKLASEGVRLTSCYSASPLCSPARAGLMTGRTPTRSGIYSWIAGGNPMHLKKDETTIATLLKKAGYLTAHVGKWHLNGKFNHPSQTQPNDHGFDHWYATQNNASPTHHNPRNFVRNGKPVGQQEGYSCQLVADEAIQWLKLAHAFPDSARHPFFLFVCFHEPHEPIASPEELVKNYPDAKKKGEALYYANVANMDRAVGRLMKTLDELHFRENTLVVFTSDNGPETLNRYKNAWRSHGSPGPLRGMKLHVREGGIRVPGIIRFPGKIEAGIENETPVSSVDLLPTCCELANVKIPQTKTLDGISLVPLIKGEEVKRTKPLFWHYYGALGGAQVAIRDGDWKMVATWNGPANWAGGSSLRPGVVPTLKQSKLVSFELYNVKEDIAEKHELSQKHPDRFRAMSDQIQKLYTEVINEGPDWSFKK